jgi:ATP-dependent Clp protease ATP-binding subunit ClpB
MRRRPYCVNIFDEMEKADKKIFDLFLQINDKGRLTNSAGLVASFANSINIVTSNIGQEYFYDEKLNFAEASSKAKEDLGNTEKSGYRNEVLNRFTGIYSFKTLEAEQLVKVAKRQFNELGKRLEEKGLSLLTPTDGELLDLCKDHYIRRKGARSIQKYLRENIAGDISLMMLQNPGAKGIIRTSYDRAAKKIRSQLETAAPANSHKAAKKATPAGRAGHKGCDELHPSFPGA